MAYNGWSNRETWLINVHFNPVLKSDVDNIKDQFEEMLSELPSFFQDYIDESLIDWDELKESCDDDDQESEED